MDKLALKYGCNPNQKPACIRTPDGSPLPLKVLNSQPGYINLMDALNAWQLVCALKQVTSIPAAASFKHVSPAGAALGLLLTPALKKACQVDDLPDLDDSPIACAYARARGADRLSAFGDFIALSDKCDAICARLIAREVSDGIIAPGYSQEALEILRKKRQGKYTILEMDPDYEPPAVETRQIFGLVFEQGYNDAPINRSLLQNLVTKRRELTAPVVHDLLLALITLKYTQSNSVCLSLDGQAVGIGAGQQSRVHCVRLACDKADLGQLRQHEKVLSLPFLPQIGRPSRDNAIEAYIQEGEAAFGDYWQALFHRQPPAFSREEKRSYLSSKRGLSLASDAFFPFDDSVIRAHRSGVDYIAQPGGSVRDEQVIETCDRQSQAMAFTGLRLFHH